MSEYQYYEFRAIDRPLADAEMKTLRSYSTRATITSGRFVNEYSWGSFKGDEDKWMEKYFDAFLYLANWGTRVLKFRFPSQVLPLEAAAKYRAGDSAVAWEKDGKTIVSFTSQEEDGDYEWLEGEGELDDVLHVRAEIGQGDMRALYLGWLLGLQSGDLSDKEEEPPVPPNLKHLSGAIRRFAEFLHIDEDLIAAAAAASADVDVAEPDTDAAEGWVRTLSESEKDKMILRLMRGESGVLSREIAARFRQEQVKAGGKADTPPCRAPRTAGALWTAAEEERRRREERETKAKARKKQKAALAREKHLDGVAGREAELWAEVDRLVQTKDRKAYDEAVKILTDLRDVAARSGREDFGPRLVQLRKKYATRSGLLNRLSRLKPGRERSAGGESA